MALTMQMFSLAESRLINDIAYAICIVKSTGSMSIIHDT